MRRNLLFRFVLATAQLAAIAWFSPGRGLPLDDAWIHQVVARTFAETGTLGYAPGQHGAAATSYLWGALLAIDFKVLHLGPDRWALLLNALALLGTGQLLYSLLGRARPADVSESAWDVTSLATAMFAGLSPNLLWFTCSGMEAMPLVALSLTAIWAASSTPTLRNTAITGVAAGALALLRPEAIPLGGLLALYMFRKQSIKGAALAGAPWAMAVALYVGSNLAKTGQPLPSTLEGRRWLWFETSSGLSRSDLALDFFAAWGTRLGSYTFDTSVLVIWVFVAIAAYGAIWLARVRANDGMKLLFAWALFHTSFYALLLPTPGHGGRYQPFIPLLFAACVPLGTVQALRSLARLGGVFSRVRFGWFAAVGMAPWIVLALPVAQSLRDANALAVAHIQATEIDAGVYVGTLPEGNVASFDIGGIGYASGRRVLDLGGLSDPKTAALLKSGRVSTWLEANHVRWLVLPESYEPVLPTVEDFRTRLHLQDNDALVLDPVRVFETPFNRWEPAIRATWNAAPKQVVYEVRYTSRPGPREGAPAATPLPIDDPKTMVRRRDRSVAEHMLATLAAWNTPVDVHLSSEPSATTSSACALRLGWWGFAVDGCTAVGDPAALKAMAYEHAGRYLDAGDIGGALRALPHVVAQLKRRTDPGFYPPLTPLIGPTQGGAKPPPASAFVLFFGVLLAALVIEGLARDGRTTRVLSNLRARFASPALALLLLGGFASCGPRDVTSAIREGRGAVELALARGDKVGDGAIFEAVDSGDSEIVALLLAHGARVDAKDLDKATPLHHAARRGHHAALEVLIAAGADVEATAGVRARTALHDAAIAGSIDAVRVLLRAGAKPSTSDTFGQTPLHLVAAPHAEAIAKLLLDAGADPTIADARGFTTLHAAAAVDNAPMVRALVSHDPSLVSRVTPLSETAFDVAMRYQRDRAAEALLGAGAAVTAGWPPLHDAARMDAVGRVADLLAAGADTNRHVRDKTALDVAVEHGSKRVEALLRAPRRERAP